jgi:phosphohistidine phosphatase
MKLYILRHGEAALRDDSRFERDADRELTPKGLRRTTALAHALQDLEITFDAILASPLVRARQTAEIIERELQLHGRLEVTDHLAPSHDVESLVDRINAIRPSPDSILLVGHEPDSSRLISLLCTGDSRLSLSLKKGGLCRMEIASLHVGKCATLEWLLAPRWIR